MLPKNYNPKNVPYRMGCKRDPPHKDGPLLMKLGDVAQLPSSYGMTDVTPVESQGNCGSCTGNAADNASKIRASVVTGNYFNGSRLAVYYFERKHDGTISQGDCGSSLSTAAWVLENIGIAPETLWPYDESQYNVAPPDSYMQQAVKDETTTATRLDAADESQTIDNIKAALVSNYPVMFGFSCYNEIFNVGTDGNVPMPTEDESSVGGHATCIIGYNDNHQNPDGSTGAILFKNSWGVNWGCQKDGTIADGSTNGGYAWLPYSYFLDTDDDVGDCWAIVYESDFPNIT